MGTFIGHLVPGLALALLGVWHVINVLKANFGCNHRRDFTIRFWYPFPRIRYMELISIFSFSLFAIITQLIDFSTLKFMCELDVFEHATMFFHLLLFSVVTLLADLNGASQTLVSGALAASVFSQELFLLHFHSTDHVGLEGHYHWLLQLIVSASLLFTILALTCHTSFPVGLLLSVSVLFQGLWFINMGFVLWVPWSTPQGCYVVPRNAIHPSTNAVHSAVACESPEADTRARALANLQFSWILAGLMIFSSSCYLMFVRKSTSASDSTKYQTLGAKGEDSHVAMYGFIKENP